MSHTSPTDSGIPAPADGRYSKARIANLVGQEFGDLAVISFIGRQERSQALWLCKCKCGATTNRTTNDLVKSHAVRCSVKCPLKPLVKRPREDLTGKVFGKFTVLSRLPPRGRNSQWLCQCKCGEIRKHDGYTLRKGKAAGCNKCCETSYKWEGTGDISKTFWTMIEGRAAYKGQEFKISIDFGWELFLKQDRKCVLTGEPLVFAAVYKTGTSKKQTASLDRIDSSIGYLEHNVQWVHKVVNVMKMHSEQNDFIAWCRKVSEHNK